MYGIETTIWKNGKSRIRSVQMDNLRGFLGTRRMDKVPECTDKSVLRSDEEGR